MTRAETPWKKKTLIGAPPAEMLKSSGTLESGKGRGEGQSIRASTGVRGDHGGVTIRKVVGAESRDRTGRHIQIGKVMAGDREARISWQVELLAIPRDPVEHEPVCIGVFEDREQGALLVSCGETRMF